MFGFIYPNELEINWGLFIVLYPYLTGLVAGAFIVSSLYHVFGVKELKPVSRLSLIAALAVLLVAPLALISHLGHPARALNLMWTPNPTSAMAGFGYIYSFYLIIVLLEIWFMYRQDLVELSSQGGFMGKIYNLLTLGAKDVSPRSLDTDHRVVGILAIIGIPSAAFLHGYVGFIFGAVKANPWWSTPLMPVIFLLSAIVSGIALLIVVYAVTSWLRGIKTDDACMMKMNSYLWAFLILAFTLEVLEVLHMGYEGEENWPAVKALITQVLPFSYLLIQMLLGMVVPLFILMAGRWQRASERVRQGLTVLSGVLVLIGVLAMRFNVVVGGQMVSKSLEGFTEFHFPLWEEGVIPTAGFLILPFLILAALVKLLPPWMEEGVLPGTEKRRAVGSGGAHGMPFPAFSGARSKYGSRPEQDNL